MKRISEGLLHGLLWLFLLPPLMLAVSSFTADGTLLKAGSLGELTVQQYRDFLQNRELLMRFRNSAVLAGGALLAGLPAAILGGFWMHRGRSRFAACFRLLAAVAVLLPAQSIMVPVFRLSKWTGLYDHLLSVILMQVFFPLGPLAVFFFLGRIPEEQWEAGWLDCNSSLRIYVRGILPQLRYPLVMLTLLLFAEAWNLVEWPLILLPDPGLQPASLALNDITESGRGSYAAAMLYCLPAVIACIVLTQKSPRRGFFAE